MKRKIFALLIVLTFSICLTSIAFAENSSLDDVKSADVDDSNYIKIVSISNGEIKFSDGFTGYALDLSKSTLEKGDTFIYGQSSSGQTENYVKLAIIEAYKQKKESNLGGIISKIVEGNIDTSDDVIKAVVDSGEKVGGSSVASIDDTTEATFTFETLKSTDDEKSDCLAYTVSLKTVEKSDKLAASDDSNNASDGDNSASNQDNNDDKQSESADKQTVKEDNNNQSESTDKQTVKEDNNKQSEDANKTEEKPKTVENNKTIVKNTTTVIENNTTIIHNNVNDVNNTTEPKNDTVSELLKAGNPILILIVVIVVALIAVFIMKRKD